MDAKIVRTEDIEVDGGTIPINLWCARGKNCETWGIEVGGIEWASGILTSFHATTLFNILRDHLTEYVHYVAV